MNRTDYRFTVFQNRAQKNVNTYTLHDKTINRAVREFYRLCHSTMINVLGDALYPDEVEYELKISEDKSVAVILVGDGIEYCLRCNEITVYEDNSNFRVYRGYGINWYDNTAYIVIDNRIVASKTFDSLNFIDDDDKFDKVYDYIDHLELEKGKIKHG